MTISGINPNARTCLFVPKITKLTRVTDDINRIFEAKCIKCNKHNPRSNTTRCTETSCSTYQEMAKLRERLVKK